MVTRLRSFLPTAALGFLIIYFSVHAMTGDRGFLSSGQRDAALATKTEELDRIHTQRLELEARARLLRDESLSADLLEERARSLLGFVDPKDYVIRLRP